MKWLPLLLPLGNVVPRFSYVHGFKGKGAGLTEFSEA